jgi:hypothetical protein
MANALYDKGRESFLKGEIAIASDNIKCVLCDTALYTKNLATDQFLTSITGSARIATSGNLASKTTSTGIFGAANVTFSAVTGAACALLVIYQDTGSAATSRLIAAIDTATNLPVTPNGGDILISFDTGTNKVFKL